MRYLPLLLVLSFTSCINNQSNTASAFKAFEDSLTIAKKADSLTRATIKSALLDTTGLYMSPIKIIKAKIVQREYSNFKDISLTYKNVSDKKVSAVRFNWYGENAFGEPADMGGFVQEGFGGGFDDDPLSSGKTRSAQFNILSRNAKKVILAWPREVVFEDGSKWQLR